MYVILILNMFGIFVLISVVVCECGFISFTFSNPYAYINFLRFNYVVVPCDTAIIFPYIVTLA